MPVSLECIRGLSLAGIPHFALCFLAAMTTGASSVVAAQTGPATTHSTATLSADQILAIGDAAQKANDLASAEAAYRALLADRSAEVRIEARFRLAMMFATRRRFADAAVLLREILDERPGALRVRLELARVLELMGDDAGARRALREAQAGGLPPDVARLVDRYSAALRAQKPLGGSFDIALAPDSNINHASRSDTLGTVLGEFDLDEDAKEQSGIGIALRGQAYARTPIGRSVNLFARVSGSADLYRRGDFDDVAVAASIGPELKLGADRLSFEGGRLWRWYGGQAFSRAWTVGLNYIHPVGRKSQLRGSARLALVDNRFNRALDGRTYSASLSYERALSNRGGIGIMLSADRQALRAAGYSTWGGQVTAFGYRELGAVTLVATLGLGRLRADQRLFLFPKVRSDRLYRASLGATLRNLRIGSLAPFLRASLERNRSTSELYDYRKLRTEIGVARAF